MRRKLLILILLIVIFSISSISYAVIEGGFTGDSLPNLLNIGEGEKETIEKEKQHLDKTHYVMKDDEVSGGQNNGNQNTENTENSALKKQIEKLLNNINDISSTYNNYDWCLNYTFYETYEKNKYRTGVGWRRI